MKNFNNLMNDMKVRKNLAHLTKSVMARRCCKFETVTYFEKANVGKNQRMCVLVESCWCFLSEGGCLQTIQNFIFKCSDSTLRSTKSES